jgi:nucleoid DNA-binding protein
MLKHVIHNNVIKQLVKLRVANILMKLCVKRRVKIRAFGLKKST